MRTDADRGNALNRDGAVCIGKCPHVVVAIISYRRPHGLERLLKSLQIQKELDGFHFKYSILVVDNDREASARPVVEQISEKSKIDVRYVVEERLGIPFARNMALDAAGEEADFVAFLDDDEWVPETWLGEMLKVQRETGGDCVWGAVIPQFPPNTSRFLIESGIYGHESFPDKVKVPIAATNNVLMRNAFVRQHSLRFDERLINSGGSCVRFFRAGAKRGMNIYLSKFGLAFEEIPKSRLRWSWIIKRQYRLGNSLVRADALDAWIWIKLLWALAGVVCAVVGAVLSIGVIVSPKVGRRGITWLLRGLGIVGGAFGLAIGEYAVPRLSREREIDAGSREVA